MTVERIKRYLRLRVQLSRRLGTLNDTGILNDLLGVISDEKFLEQEIRNMENVLRGTVEY